MDFFNTISNDPHMYALLFYWILPLAFWAGLLFIVLKLLDLAHTRYDPTNLLPVLVKWGLIISLVLAVLVWLSHFGPVVTVLGWLGIVGGWIGKLFTAIGFSETWHTTWLSLSQWAASWYPVYLRAFVFVVVVGAITEYWSLYWKISFTRTFNILASTAVCYPFILCKYATGSRTPFFDFIHSRVLKSKILQSLNDGDFMRLRDSNGLGGSFDKGMGGTNQDQTIKHFLNQIKRAEAYVDTRKDLNEQRDMRHARIFIPGSGEPETDAKIESALKNSGNRLSGAGSNIRFQDDFVYDSEAKFRKGHNVTGKANGNNGGFELTSQVDYNAGQELGSFWDNFDNPFSSENSRRNGGRGAFAIFRQDIIDTFSYFAHLTPVAIVNKIDDLIAAQTPTTEKPRKVLVRHNLDLNVFPKEATVGRGIGKGNTITEQKQLAEETAKKKVAQIMSALNDFGVSGQFQGYQVGGNSAIYRVKLAASSKTDFDKDKLADAVRDYLGLSSKPIVLRPAGAVEISIENDGVVIPIDFTEMIRTSASSRDSIISGMVGVDAMGNNIYIELGDKVPHAMLFGKTGTGKTVTIMTALYSIMDVVTPEQLRIAYVDGKGNSFEFMRTDDQGQMGYHPNPYTYMQPADASGDIAYARALINMMVKTTRDRIDLFKRAGVAKLASYNDNVTKEREHLDFIDKSLIDGSPEHAQRKAETEAELAKAKTAYTEATGDTGRQKAQKTIDACQQTLDELVIGSDDHRQAGINLKKARDQYHEIYGQGVLPEILFVVDEFSAITDQDKNLKAGELAELGTVDKFEYIAKMSRSVGLRMLLANQTARKEKVPGKISANVVGRISLGVTEPIESDIALPETGIALNLVSEPGEFYSTVMKGSANPEHGNSPYITEDQMNALNDALWDKFGPTEYVMSREALLGETDAKMSDDNRAVSHDAIPAEVEALRVGDDIEMQKEYGVSKGQLCPTSTEQVLDIIKKYPAWSVQNRSSADMFEHPAYIQANKIRPSQRKKELGLIASALEEQAQLLDASENADTRKSAGSKLAKTSETVKDKVARSQRGTDKKM